MKAKKENGVYNTPQQLADFVARMAINNSAQTILDPAYGEGALLLSAHKRLIALGSRHSESQLFGYDILPPKNGVLDAFDEGILIPKHLVKSDYFSVHPIKETRKYDVILINPPFVRHHLIPDDKLSALRMTRPLFAEIPKTSDYYSYFLIHSMSFLSDGGRLVAILPWSFLYAGFAQALRKKLSDHFDSFKIIIIGERLFDDIDERILVLICDKHGRQTKRIALEYFPNIPMSIRNLRQIGRDEWENTVWKSLAPGSISTLLERAQDEFHFSKLGDSANVRIGTVTGANKYFILDREKSNELKVPSAYLKPILRHSNCLRSLYVAKESVHEHLLAIPKEDKLIGQLSSYIKNGEELKINQGHHLKSRDPWYSVPVKAAPHAFLHYMTNEIPFIVRNPEGLLSTNTIHNLNFILGTKDSAIKWIQFSMFSSISQLSIEREARTYGGGVLKIEPSAAKNILVYSGDGKSFPRRLGKHIDHLVKTRKIREAMEYADEEMLALLSLPPKYLKRCQSFYEKLRDLRLGRGSKGLRKSSAIDSKN